MPATCASSEAVRARPSIKACSIPARVGSPAIAATSANLALLAMNRIRQHRTGSDTVSYSALDLDVSAVTVTCPDHFRQNGLMRRALQQTDAEVRGPASVH